MRTTAHKSLARLTHALALVRPFGRQHAVAASPPPPPLLSERDFHTAADAALSSIEQALEAHAAPLEAALSGGGQLDVALASGVLTLRLGARGTYVLNKQTPTRQIWWSSPVSGPRRFALAGDGRWVSLRDGRELLADLQAELQALVGYVVELGKAR